MLRLYTFGGLRIERDGEPLHLPTQKARDLLGYLIVFRDRPHPRTALVGVLWPDLPEDKARRRLSDTLWRLRHVLGDYVQADERYVWLNEARPCRLDVAQFEAALSQEPARPAIAPLEAALALYHGPFLDGRYHDWALLERERLRGLYLEGLGRLLQHHKQVGAYAKALNVAQRLITVEPLHEAAHRELMRIYHLLGRDAEAIAQYHHFREILQEELSVAPAPETEVLYQVLSRRPAAPANHEAEIHLPASARSPTPKLDELPLVGREAERAALLDHLEAAASGHGGIVLLEGEPGIGKSRLARELVAGARWRNIEAIVARRPEEAPCSYGLFRASLAPMLTPLRTRQLARLIAPDHLRAVAPLFPLLAHVLTDLPPPAELPPPQAHERVHEALVALALSLARIMPCLWIWEDLQDADAESLALLPRLAPRLRERRGLILLTGRSAELRAAPKVWRTLQTLDRAGPLPRHTLSRLDREAIGALMEHLLGEAAEDDNAALAEHLMRESGGVPLYLVETLKAWRDQALLRPDAGEQRPPDGAWHWSGDAPAALPPSLGEAIIGHRLAQLSSGAEQVLATAAVIGNDVDFDLLARVCAFPAPGAQRTAADPYLLTTNELLRLGFLEETDVGYRFSHAKVRQAAYGRLSRCERRRRHRKVAQALADLTPDQFERIAYHFEAAGQRDAARHYLSLAIEEARDLFAHRSALACYDRLLDLLTDPQARYDALRDRAEVLGWIGDRAAQGRDIEEMLRLARALSDDVRVAGALHCRSEWHRLQGRYEAANADARAALEIYRRLGDDHARADLLSQLGRNVIYTGDDAQAAIYFRAALTLYEAMDDPDGQIGCLIGLAHVAEFEGDYMRNLSYCQRALALAESASAPRRTSHAYFAVGVTYYDLGDMDAAQTHFRAALRLAETMADRRRQGVSYFYLGMIALERGAFTTAQEHLDAAQERLREVHDISWAGSVRAALGRLALRQDDPATAKRHLEIAYRRCQTLGEESYAVVHLSYLARAELALEHRSRAWEQSLEAVADVEAGHLEVEHPQRITYNHFFVAAATRHWAAARAALEKAAQIVDERAERITAPAFQATYRDGLSVNRAIAEALAKQPSSGQLRVRLARADVAAHRRPAPDEIVTVIWTVNAGAVDAALAQRQGQIALRRHRILRLLDEAQDAGALPTVADLAGALDVSTRTLRTDLAALRDRGHPAHTRGSRA